MSAPRALVWSVLDNVLDPITHPALTVTVYLHGAPQVVITVGQDLHPRVPVVDAITERLTTSTPGRWRAVGTDAVEYLAGGWRTEGVAFTVNAWYWLPVSGRATDVDPEIPAHLRPTVELEATS